VAGPTPIFFQRALLLAPDSVSRAAAARTALPEERWLLCQRRSVRQSFARQVLAARDEESAQQIWMLRQPDEVRESYIREVLERSS
jgi:hypothetical protein